jgi:penicillin amidase
MLLGGVAPKGAAAQRCLGLIQGWDGVASPESGGAAAWYVFEAALIEVAVEDELGALTPTYVRASLSGASLLERDLAHFLPDRPAGVEQALGRACERLEAELGADPRSWTWGALHPLQLKHALGDVFKRWNLPEVPYGGSPNTVNAGDFRLGQWPAWTTTIASMRLIMPLSDLSQSSFSHPGGQSGMPRAEGGRDLWPVWLAGERRPLRDAPPAGASALRLVPASH